MPSIVFRTPLTAEEQGSYGQHFKKLDPESLGIVTGEAVKPLFSRSGLNSQSLSQIWSICDTGNQGFLNASQFNAALRMIGHLQANASLPVTSELYQTPAPRLAFFGSQGQVSAEPTGTPVSSAIPAVSGYDVSKFAQLFDRSANGAQFLAGDKAKEIFLKAKLPTQTLGAIWALCDRNNTGTLSKPEFVMAMHLIQTAMLNPSVALPNTLPAYLWESVNVRSPAHAPLSRSSTGLSSNSSVARQPSIARVSSSTFTNAASDWTLTYEKKQQFDAIFDSLDKNKTGTLGSQVLVPFFLSSRLNQDTLATVWDLADIHNNAEFSKLEFAIAMFLIQKKNSGLELPDVVPDQLLQSPALGLYNQAPQQVSQDSYPHPSIPSRDTKPSFDEQPRSSQLNQSALGDLLALNESFSSPQPSPQPQAPVQITGESGLSAQNPSLLTSSTTGMRKFQPSSTFGQNIIKEEESQQYPVNTQQQISQQQQQQPQQQQHALPQQPAPLPSHSQAFHQQPLQSSNSFQETRTAVIQGNTPSQSGSTTISQPPVQSPQQAYSSSLPSVPNFASVSLPQSSQTRDLFADGEASIQLSQATTELANLSNQVGSLSKQATLVNDKKAKAQQELQRINDLKSSIESKMITLRASYEQEVKQTEQVEGLLAQSRKESEDLKQQMAVAEANYHTVQGTLTELQQQLQESEQANSQLKEKIGNLNALASSLQAELTDKQQKVKQEKSMVDVNSKQLEVSQITVNNLQQEIQGLEENLIVFLQKHKELDSYRSTLEQQHGELNSKHQELEGKHVELNQREQEVQQRTKQIEEQEQIYHQQIAKLQTMFNDLAKQRDAFSKADEELQNQQLEYAQKVQELSERQMKLAMGEVPEDASTIVKNSRAVSSANQDHVAKFVEETVTNSRLGAQEDDEKQGSDVFDKDVPTVGSQTEVDDDDGGVHDDETAAEALADRFDGDLNEYGIPRTESLTSSVVNNPPQSVRDDAEPELQEAVSDETFRNTASAESRLPEEPAEKTMPGGWAATETNTVVSSGHEALAAGTQPTVETGARESAVYNIESVEDQSTQKSNEELHSKASSSTVKNTIDEEFPPIQELDIDESDSSLDDDHFEDSKDVIAQDSLEKKLPVKSAEIATPQKSKAEEQVKKEEPVTKEAPITEEAPATKKAPVNTSIPQEAEFEDEFAGLEQAAPEEDDSDELDNADSSEGFETIEHKDLDDELQQGGFTGSSGGNLVRSVEPGSSVVNSDSAPVDADEWDEIFAGFGNSNVSSSPAGQTTQKPVQKISQEVLQQPTPEKSSTHLNAPVSRGIATTPKSLAIEELSSMGFTNEEASKALERCNWDLEAATNYLLDSS